MVKKIKILKKDLINLYKNRHLTTYEVAKKYNCCQATVWKKLHMFNIKPRKLGPRNSKVPSKSELIKLYLKNKFSTWEIEKDYGYSRGTVHRKLKEYNIEIRNRAKSHIIHPRRSFSGSLLEKAYLIGFRLGDLRVRKQYKNSESINVACGSTVNEQINLIKELLSPYCRVWVSQKSLNKKMNIQGSLDLSFSFLLSKDIPKWVLSKKDYFFSFLAGFTDTEGWIGLSKGRQAVYSLGNYRKAYLIFIRKGLKKYGLNFPKIVTGKMKGTIDKQGYIKNSDYYSLRTSKKSTLIKLLSNLEPYIKHKNKVKSLKIATNNINERNKKFGNINM